MRWAYSIHFQKVFIYENYTILCLVSDKNESQILPSHICSILHPQTEKCSATNIPDETEYDSSGAMKLNLCGIYN